MNVFCYYRVSPRNLDSTWRSNGASTDSITTQRDFAMRWVKSEGANVVGEEHDELVSADSEKCDGLNRALRYLEHNAGTVLLVLSLDRLSRDTVESLRIERQIRQWGCRLRIVTEDMDASTPDGELMFTIKAAANMYERRRTRARTKRALQSKKMSGFRTSGRAPYGFRFVEGPARRSDGGRVKQTWLLAADEGEVRIIRALRELVAAMGRENFSTLRRALKSRGFGTIRGNPIHTTEVQRLLASMDFIQSNGGFDATQEKQDREAVEGGASEGQPPWSGRSATAQLSLLFDGDGCAQGEQGAATSHNGGHRTGNQLP